MKLKTLTLGLMTLSACLTAFPEQAVTPTCDEVRLAAEKWIYGLQGKAYKAELRAKDGVSPLPAKAVNDHLFAFQEGDLYIGIGFSKPPKPESTLAELRSTLMHIALDRVPVPGVKAANWDTRLMTPVSSFKEGVTLESWNDGVLRVRVQSSFFAAAGNRTDLILPMDTAMPEGTYFQIRRPIKADLLIEGRLLAAAVPQKHACGLTASLAAKTGAYTLAPELKGAGEAIAKTLAAHEKPVAAAPAIDLELVLKNEGGKPVTIQWGGDVSGYKLALQGPGAVCGDWPVMMTMEFRSGRPVTIAPGAVMSVPVKSLAFGPRDIASAGCWWTVPGEYTLTATVHFGLGGGGEAVSLTTLPLKLTVK